MNSGDLKWRVTIEEDTSTDDNPATSWSTLATDWPCMVKAVSGEELKQGAQVEARVGYEVMGRYRTDMTPGHRLSVTGGPMHVGVTLNIVSVRKVYDQSIPALALECEEVVSI